MVSCGRHPTQFHLTGLMKTKEEIIQRLSEYFADTLVECIDYVHDGQLTAEDVASLLLDELENWMAYHTEMTNAATAIRYVIQQRVS